MSKNIVIYPHNVFNDLDGGVTVQYYLAYVLDKLGKNVMICNKHDNNSSNNIFNKFIFENEIDIENTIVIYCEGIFGNPLKAKYIVRWMLSKLGQNVPTHYYFTWKKNELVYFFNTEIDIINNNVDYKQLSVVYLNNGIKNLYRERNGICYTNRKFSIHSKIKKIHPDDAYEITRQNSQQELIEIFNNHEIFISYDPLTFLSLIAAMCGCISIIYPIEGVSKKDYLKMTALYDYLNVKNVQLYGVAYGTDEDELLFAKNTIHLVKKQIEDIQQWFIDKYVINFIKDLDNFDDNKNILSIYKGIMVFNSTEEQDFDVEFYKEYNPDLHYMNYHELIHHYKYYGKKEGRFASDKQVKDFVEDENFDVEFYKEKNPDLHYMSYRELIHHYKNYGKKEGRCASDKQIKDFVEDENFVIQFYKEQNPDLHHMSYRELIHHYKNYGKKELRFGSEKQIKDFVEDENFDLKIYKENNQDLKHMTNRELIHHYKNYGKKEGRFASEKQIKDFVEDDNFDIEFYKKYNPDLHNMTNRELIHHYKNYGKKEGRCASDKQIKDFVEDDNFDIEFYRKFHSDLHNMTYYELIHHYKNNGKKEKRVISPKYAINLNKELFIWFFYDSYKNFDIKFYKAFNTDILFDKDIDYLYYHHNDVEKKRLISLDQLNDVYNPTLYQLLNLDLKYIDDNHIISEEIEFIKSSIISKRCTKEINDIEFNKIFFDFDIDFYKKNNNDLLNYLIINNITDEISKKFLKQHFYNFGRFERRIYNNKIKIIIVSDLFTDSGHASGGALACYYLAYLINNLKSNFYAKILTYSNSIIQNNFCNDLAIIGEINNNTILIYPDGSAGNPFSGKYVIRWMLQELGNFRPKDFFKFWSKDDFVYHWENLGNLKKIRILLTPYMNEKYKIDKETHFKREGSCYLIKKYKYNNDINNLDFHENESILIDNLPLDGIIKTFQTTKTFYCYDINSFHWLAALLCGCKSIVYPLKYTKEEWYSKTCFNYTKILYDKIAYGKKDIENTVEFTEDEIKTFVKCINDNTHNNLLNFLDDIYNIIINNKYENIPTVEDIYYNN